MISQSKLNKFCGWIPPAARTIPVAKSHERILNYTKIFSAAGFQTAGTGEGKVALLHKYLEKVNGGEFPVNEQTIGDCVSHGWGSAIETLIATSILANGKNESFPGRQATEWIYGTSRVIQGGGRLGNGDGSLGSWANAAVKENGTLLRGQHKDEQSGKTYDLSSYSGKTAKSFGYRGLPMGLEVIADEHPVKQTALVTTWEEVRDSIANGYPVAVCSNQGFSDVRDEHGFAAPKGQWAHCMYFCSVDDEFHRPGVLCVNSWGPNWIRGPKRHEQPDGSFWIDAEIVERMVRGRDSYAISSYEGFPAQQLNYILW